jgi:hypothetical protein
MQRKNGFTTYKGQKNYPLRYVMGKRISIKAGVITAFDGDELVPGVEFVRISKTRVSRILPTNLILKAVFKALRCIAKDESVISDWTRGWQCKWVVVVDNTEQACFYDRARAIEFEKALIYQMGRFN